MSHSPGRISLAGVVAFFTFVALDASVFAVDACAQPYPSNGGLTYVEQFAKDSIGNDAVLYVTFAFGIDPVTLGQAFDIETGLSSHWVYRYYSPSRNKVYQHILYQAAPGFFSGYGQVIPPDAGVSEAIAIDTNGSYANSTAMAAAIRSNPVYQEFRTANGFVLILVETFTRGTTPIPGMPDDFTWNNGLWTMMFQDEEDTTKQMYCFVAATTGQTYCVSGVVTGIDESAGAALSMKIVPNPAVGSTRVTITAANVGRDLAGVRIGLFNAAGQQVIDLTEEFASSGYRDAVFDASALPAGSYYCRAVGTGFNGVIGTIVLDR